MTFSSPHSMMNRSEPADKSVKTENIGPKLSLGPHVREAPLRNFSRRRIAALDNVPRREAELLGRAFPSRASERENLECYQSAAAGEGLAFLAANDFVFVANALALV